ncbi:MAG: hypothetical protein GXP31_00260 [Kiritimatiellaeota bacterium]|nr:hypothetical protein [Kiritimatiellota bacterium]
MKLMPAVQSPVKCGILFLAVLFLPCPVRATQMLSENFESRGAWQEHVRGKGSISLVPGGVHGKCLKTVSEAQALVYYSLKLDPEKVRGKSILIRCKVRIRDVVRGPKVYSTAKIHVGIRTADRRTLNFATRFTGTADWSDKFLAVDVPEDAQEVVLDLGIQNGTGTAWYDDLTVDDGVREQAVLDIASVANSNFHDETPGDGFGFLDAGPPDLSALPLGYVRFRNVDFYIRTPARNFGRTCVVLAGRKRPQLPKRIETVIPVKMAVKRLFFLQAAAWSDPTRQRPCLQYTLRFADGRTVDIPMREGIEIGSLWAPKDLPGWKLAWETAVDGRKVGVGIAEWQNPRPDVPISWIRLSSPGDAAVPVVLAISADPAKKTAGKPGPAVPVERSTKRRRPAKR